jgi:hypothetical protein
VQDGNGVRVAYVYCMGQDEMASASTAGGKLTRDEARRIANGIAKLPVLLSEKRSDT